MSERMIQCPKCRSVNVETVKVHNPETHDMNADATLRCRDCNHEWEGRVGSDYHHEQRRRGWRI
jgi:transposase-like protein